MLLYELLHAIEHWPFETWMPLIENPRWGWFWKKAYSFHLRHHAVIECNESISGFFTLPVADLVFGTFVLPETLYADGEEWMASKFRNPRPYALIRWCDRLTNAMVKRRRERARKKRGLSAETAGQVEEEELRALTNPFISGKRMAATGRSGLE